MGREVKRVAMDFQWPIGKTWEGFLSPKDLDAIACDACEQSGLNPETHRLSKDWYDNDNHGRTWWYDYKTGIDGKPAERSPWKVFGTTTRWMYELTQEEVDHLIEEGRLNGHVNTWDATKREWVRDPAKPWPTAEQINHAMQFGMGHDAINQWICVKFRATRLGFYGQCAHCRGEGFTYRDDAHRAASEAWKPTEPPAGEGWQMWETTSEGSPISPVLETPERLAAWLVRNKASAFGGDGASFAAWMRMIDDRWAPSSVMRNGSMQSGVAAAANLFKPVFSVYPLPDEDDPIEYEVRGDYQYQIIRAKPSHGFEGVFPNAVPEQVEECRQWLKERRIACTEHREGDDVILSGTLLSTAAFEFKTRWR